MKLLSFSYPFGVLGLEPPHRPPVRVSDRQALATASGQELFAVEIGIFCFKHIGEIVGDAGAEVLRINPSLRDYFGNFDVIFSCHLYTLFGSFGGVADRENNTR